MSIGVPNFSVGVLSGTPKAYKVTPMTRSHELKSETLGSARHVLMPALPKERKNDTRTLFGRPNLKGK